MAYEEITVGRFYSMKLNWYVAGLRFCRLAEQAGVPADNLGALRAHCSRGALDCTPYLDNASTLSRKDWDEHWKRDRSEENEIFQLAVDAARGTIAPAHVVSMLKNAYIRLLNSFEWNVIEKQVMLDGRLWTSRITPMNRHYAERIGDGSVFAAYGTTGMGSMTPRLTTTPQDLRTDEENHRITNFWMTELLYGDEPMFAGFRSGSLSGKLIGASDAQLNRKNALQLLEAVALEQEYRRRAWRRKFVEASDRKITLVSINLQTGNKLGGEGRMIREQRGVLDQVVAELEDDDGAADDQELSRLRDERHRGYSIEVLSFNCEVNNIGGLTFWSNNNSEQSWNSLFNKAAFYHHALRKSDYPTAPFTMQAITALTKKFRQTSKSELLRPSNDYKIASRLAALAYLSGCHVHFNCKSGKDCTGLMDIEVKRLMASMYGSFLGSGEVTVPQYSLSGHAAEKSSYRTLLADSGNFEVQEYNTGGRGFKVAQLSKFKISPSDNKLASRFGSGGGLQFAYGLKAYMDIDDLGKKAT
jgi:phosphatidylinositol-4,5-bisphosphate 4-phosphatase